MAACDTAGEPSPDARANEAIAAIAPAASCDVVDADRHYRCPYREIPAASELLFTTMTAQHELAAGRLDASFALTKNIVLTPPTGWQLMFSSISPDRRHLLLTMFKPGCSTAWPDAAGKLCSWGRNTIWLVERSADGLAWDLVNLRDQLGENSIVLAWSTWLTNRHAIFNGKARPPTVPLTMPGERSGDAYEVIVGATGTAPRVEHWSASVESPRCFIGRLHAVPVNAGQCVDGQLVSMTRRCDDEPIGPAMYAWFNNQAVDGSGPACRTDVAPPELIPVFRNYVVEVDGNCKPKAFDRNRPVATPEYAGLFRQMGTGEEWGEGQATVSADGKLLAYWVMRGYDFSPAGDPCAAFASQDGSPGNGAPRVKVCVLDAAHRCTTTQAFLPPPASPWMTQQLPHFYRGAATSHAAVLTVEGTGTALTDLVTGTKRIVIEGGFGAYPIAR